MCAFSGYVTGITLLQKLFVKEFSTVFDASYRIHTMHYYADAYGSYIEIMGSYIDSYVDDCMDSCMDSCTDSYIDSNMCSYWGLLYILI